MSPIQMNRARITHALGALAALASAATLTACGSDTTPSTASPAASGSSSSALSGTVTVFAAASLQEAFTTIKTQFEAAHPGVTVTLNFGASSALATGITQGQPADVFASASQSTMDTVVSAGAAASSAPFATNAMAIAVPPANPAGITALADLAKTDVKVAVCQDQVPCGKGAATVFTNASLTVTPVTEEADVKAVLTKVQLGEVDAGVVYVTDVKAAGDKVKGIEIPSELNASTSYPIAALSKAATPAAAQGFVEYVLSPAGAGVLAEAGFAAP